MIIICVQKESNIWRERFSDIQKDVREIAQLTSRSEIAYAFFKIYKNNLTPFFYYIEEQKYNYIVGCIKEICTLRNELDKDDILYTVCDLNFNNFNSIHKHFSFETILSYIIESQSFKTIKEVIEFWDNTYQYLDPDILTKQQLEILDQIRSDNYTVTVTHNNITDVVQIQEIVDTIQSIQNGVIDNNFRHKINAYDLKLEKLESIISQLNDPYLSTFFQEVKIFFKNNNTENLEEQITNIDQKYDKYLCLYLYIINQLHQNEKYHNILGEFLTINVEFHNFVLELIFEYKILWILEKYKHVSEIYQNTLHENQIAAYPDEIYESDSESDPEEQYSVTEHLETIENICKKIHGNINKNHF